MYNLQDEMSVATKATQVSKNSEKKSNTKKKN